MPDCYTLKQKESVKELEKMFASRGGKTTIIEMQKDYANDKQICLSSVIFLPQNIVSEINEKIIEPLRKVDPDQYYYPGVSMHLSIKNIETIQNPPAFSENDIVKVKELFNKIIPQFPTFDFNIEDVLLFPTSISAMGYSNDVLGKLVLELDRGLKEIGVPDNKKYLSDSIFWANATICRFVKEPNEQFIELVRQMRNLKIGKVEAKRISLITCNAVCAENSKKIIGEFNLK